MAKSPLELAAQFTKRNYGGQQQPYVPAGNGDESGEYRDNSYGGGVEVEEETSNSHVENQEQTKDNDNISLKEDDTVKGLSFENYVKENIKDTEFGERLISNYNVGSDEAKSLVNFATQEVGVKILKINGIACYSGAVELAMGDVKEQGKYSSYGEGEVFYHEFFHCFDHILANNYEGKTNFVSLLTDEDRRHVIQNNKSFLNQLMLTRNLCTGKVLSNGKTLYETIQDECKKMKKEGVWSQLLSDYKNEVKSIFYS